MARESELQKLLRDQSRFPLGTVVRLEPRFGIEPGQPDVMVLLDGGWQSLELKVDGRRIVKSLRPHQRRWTMLALRAGARPLAAGLLGGDYVRLAELGMCPAEEPLYEAGWINLNLSEFNLELLRHWWLYGPAGEFLEASASGR